MLSQVGNPPVNDASSDQIDLKQLLLQEDAELWKFPDRQTAIGQMINAYLQGKTETDDAAVHLLFSANRWEKRQAAYHLCTKVCQPTAQECLVSTEGSVRPEECL